MKRQPQFASEIDLCARFLLGVKDGWTPYAETAGWDILLIRKEDGFQIGIQAKLRLNADVMAQAIEDGRSWAATRPGPDCRAILVPSDATGNFGRIAGYIGITIIRVRAAAERGYARIFSPDLPKIGEQSWSGEWVESAPATRHEVPEYVPDVAAGSPAPVQLTRWKISAIKIAVTLERRGFVTRRDFKAHGIDYRRWIAAEGGWLRLADGVYVAGDRMPDFRAQHPRVYEEIAATAEKWLPTIPAPAAIAKDLFAAPRGAVA